MATRRELRAEIDRLNVERAEADDATAVQIAAMQAQAARNRSATAAGTATVEACAGLLGRALAAATLATDSPTARALLTPAVRQQIGRALIRHGEWAAAVDLGAGRLRRASSWSVAGAGGMWRYTLTLPEPSGTETAYRSAADVVHVMWATEPSRPWRGVAPWQAAEISGDLLALMEQSIADEASGPVGHILPVPEPSADVRDTLNTLRGQIAQVESFAAWTGDQSRSSQAGWLTRRVGPEPAETVPPILTDVRHEIAAACGVPPELLGQTSTRRESLLLFLGSTASPIADTLAGEIEAKLGTAVALSWPELDLDRRRSAAAVAQMEAQAAAGGGSG